MLKIQRPLCPDLTFRLAHDISPENYPDDSNDAETELSKEQFILSCLQIKPKEKRYSFTDCMKDVGQEKGSQGEGSYPEERKTPPQHIPSPREVRQKTLEQLNNAINVQFHGTEARQSNGPTQIRKASGVDQSHTTNRLGGPKSARKPRKLPDIPPVIAKKTAAKASDSPGGNVTEKCLADELQEALVKSVHEDSSDSDDVFLPSPPSSRVYPKFSCNYWEDLLAVSFNSVSKNTRPMLSSDNIYLTEDSVPEQEHRKAGSAKGTVEKDGGSDDRAFPYRRNKDQSQASDRGTIPSTSDTNLYAADKSKAFERYEDPREISDSCEDNSRTVASRRRKAEADLVHADDQIAHGATLCVASGRRRRDSGDDDCRRRSSSTVPGTNYLDLEVTHRGMHRFIPRHADEIAIEIGDPLHVFKQADDLWFEAVNLRTCQRGIFPSMYATDLQFLEDDTDEDGNSHFNMRFLGSVEVNAHKGDEVLCQAINKVALSRRSAGCATPAPPLVSMEISQYGIRMLDKSKSGHESDAVFTHFFALKNISFCGFHPRNERYFGFITKHPKTYRFACHVFLGEKSTRSVVEALGNAFKRFYQEYMAFTHPTEDIYME